MMRPTLFDTEPSELAGARVADFVTAPVSTQDVHEFAQEWHYTGTSGNASWRYGLWYGASLVGVVAYNLPTMETCSSVFGPDEWSRVVHMGRLICAEDAPRNSESRLIATSLKHLATDRPETRAVLTYAAQDQGHIGTVYQATNALYTGTGGHTVIYHDQEGQRRSDYLGGAYVSEGRATAMGWVRTQGLPKHRYLYLVGTPAERRRWRTRVLLPVLPYPKRHAEILRGTRARCLTFCHLGSLDSPTPPPELQRCNYRRWGQADIRDIT